MAVERIVTAISSLSECDMLENVRRHEILNDEHYNSLGAMYTDMHRVDMYQTLPAPSHDAVLAFESAMQTSQHFAPVEHVSQTKELDFANALAMAGAPDMAVIPAEVGGHNGVLPQQVSLPSPETLLADGVRQMQSAPVEPSWMEAVPPLEVDAFQRGLERVSSLFHSPLTEALSHKDLLQLQFAMGEISAYKDVGLQIVKKSATNVEAILKQQE